MRLNRLRSFYTVIVAEWGRSKEEIIRHNSLISSSAQRKYNALRRHRGPAPLWRLACAWRWLPKHRGTSPLNLSLFQLNLYYFSGSQSANCSLCLQAKGKNNITAPILLILGVIDRNWTTSFILAVYLLYSCTDCSLSWLKYSSPRNMLFPLLFNIIRPPALNLGIFVGMASILQILIVLIIVNIHALFALCFKKATNWTQIDVR